MANNAMTHTTRGGLDYTVRDRMVTQFGDFSMGDRVRFVTFARRGRVCSVPLEHFDAQCEGEMVPVLFDDNPTSEPQWIKLGFLAKA